MLTCEAIYCTYWFLDGLVFRRTFTYLSLLFIHRLIVRSKNRWPFWGNPNPAQLDSPKCDSEYQELCHPPTLIPLIIWYNIAISRISHTFQCYPMSILTSRYHYIISCMHGRNILFAILKMSALHDPRGVVLSFRIIRYHVDYVEAIFRRNYQNIMYFRYTDSTFRTTCVYGVFWIICGTSSWI